jgi:CBS domain-containing protein
MSLEQYRRPRMVVLHARSTAYEAARAMADNHIGAIIVTAEQRVTGIVTDRDLALEIAAGGLDPRTTLLRDVMSDEVATLEITASLPDVIKTMIAHSCRRVPLTEDGRVVGIVTLDDLILDDAIHLQTARSIIVAQLETQARFKEGGAVHPTEPARPDPGGRIRAQMRRKARAENTYGRLLRVVETHTGLKARARAETALLIVLGAVCRRLTPEEARHFISQLPSKLHPDLEKSLEGPDRHVTTTVIQEELARTLALSPDDAADVLYSTCEVVADSISAGEIEDVRGQLPGAMKSLFPEFRPLRAAG